MPKLLPSSLPNWRLVCDRRLVPARPRVITWQFILAWQLLLAAPAQASLHVIFGLQPMARVDVDQNGQRIRYGVLCSPAGSLCFVADGGGVFEVTPSEGAPLTVPPDSSDHRKGLPIVERFPNPTHGRVRMWYAPSSAGSLEVQLADVQGRAVGPPVKRLLNRAGGILDLDLRSLGRSRLAAGVYYIRVRVGKVRRALRTVLLPER